MSDKLDAANEAQRLPAVLAGDIAAATVSATLISPLVAAIDRAVVENAAAPSQRPLLSTLRRHVGDSIKQPRRFVTSKSFLIVWTLYCATYVTANAADSIAQTCMPYAEQATISSVAFIPTFIVNVPLGVWKDVQFARLFGTSLSLKSRDSVAAADTKRTPFAKSASKFAVAQLRNVHLPAPKLRQPSLPWFASSTFLFRDAITLFGSFALTPFLSTLIPDRLTESSHVKVIMTQLSAPILSQVFATPLHLLGLDLIRRPDRVGWGERLKSVKNNLGGATAIRCARVLPAFGVGCVVNTELRRGLHAIAKRKK